MDTSLYVQRCQNQRLKESWSVSRSQNPRWHPEEITDCPSLANHWHLHITHLLTKVVTHLRERQNPIYLKQKDFMHNRLPQYRSTWVFHQTGHLFWVSRDPMPWLHPAVLGRLLASFRPVILNPGHTVDSSRNFKNILNRLLLCISWLVQQQWLKENIRECYFDLKGGKDCLHRSRKC